MFKKLSLLFLLLTGLTSCGYKRESFYFVAMPDYFNDWSSDRIPESFRLSLFHRNGSWDSTSSRYTTYSFPYDFVKDYREPILPGDCFRVDFDSDGNIAYFEKDRSTQLIFEVEVLPKTIEETTFIEKFSSNKSFYMPDNVGLIEFNENLNLVSAHDLYTYEALSKHPFKYKISDDNETNLVFNHTYKSKYIIKDVNGRVDDINKLLLNSKFYAVFTMYNCQLSYSYNPLEQFDISMLNTKDYSSFSISEIKGLSPDFLVTIY